MTLANFLRQAINARRGEDPEDKGIPIPAFRRLLNEKMDMLEMDHSFAGRYLNEGFSGGEKKRAEILQMAVLEPKIAILDETDSGLDIDALRIVSEGVNRLQRTRTWACWSSPTTSASSTTSSPSLSTSCWMAASWKAAARNWRCSSKKKGYDWLREKYGSRRGERNMARDRHAT